MFTSVTDPRSLASYLDYQKLAFYGFHFDEAFFDKHLNGSQIGNLFAQVLSCFSDSLFILDSELRYICCNEQFLKTTALPFELLNGRNFSFYATPNLPAYFATEFNQITTLLRAKQPVDTSLTISRSGDTELFIHLKITPYTDKNNQTLFIGMIQNLNRNMHLYQQLSESLNYDRLTGLQDYEGFYQNFSLAIQGIREQPHRYIELYLFRVHIDKLHLFYETLGVVDTDQLIVQFVRRIKDLNSTNVGLKGMARLGGGDFAMFVRTHDIAFVYEYLEKLSQLLELPFIIKNKHLYVRLSIGIAQFPKDSQTTESLLTQAEIALNHAQLNGGDDISWYEKLNYQPTIPNEHLLSTFHEALKNSQVVPYFQPKFLFDSPQSAVFEALVRWQHPNLGILQPAQFLGEVLMTLSQPLFESMIHSCIHQIIAWKRMGHASIICINIDARQLNHPRFVEFVNELVEKYDCFTKYIEFELTEIAHLVDHQQGYEILHHFHQAGIRLAIDDFGVGFATLDYLVNLPVDTIKIDRTFIDNILNDEKKQKLVKSMVAMAHALDIKVIAEGIENQQQLDYLRQIGCDGIQGYYYGKPMSAIDATDWLYQHFEVDFDYDEHWQALFRQLDQPNA